MTNPSEIFRLNLVLRIKSHYPRIHYCRVDTDTRIIFYTYTSTPLVIYNYDQNWDIDHFNQIYCMPFVKESQVSYNDNKVYPSLGTYTTWNYRAEYMDLEIDEIYHRMILRVLVETR